MQVHTTHGAIDHNRLIVSDHATLEDGQRVIATEWHLDGELVRRDVWVSKLMPMPAVGAEQGGFGG